MQYKFIFFIEFVKNILEHLFIVWDQFIRFVVIHFFVGKRIDNVCNLGRVFDPNLLKNVSKLTNAEK